MTYRKELQKNTNDHTLNHLYKQLKTTRRYQKIKIVKKNQKNGIRSGLI